MATKEESATDKIIEITPDFEYAGDGLWIDGKWYPPVYGGDDSGGAGGDGDGDEGDAGDDGGERGVDDIEDVGERLFNKDPSLSTSEIYQLLQDFGLATIPTQEAQITEAINRATARAAGSVPAITETILPQIADLRRQLSRAFTSVSKRLGSRGGGQVKAQEASTLGDFGQALQQLLASGVMQGATDKYSLQSGFRPLLQSQLPTLTSATQPFDFATAGQAIGQIGQAVQPFFGSSPSPFGTYGPTPYASPFVQNSGMNPYSGGLLVGSTGTLGGGV